MSPFNPVENTGTTWCTAADLTAFNYPATAADYLARAETRSRAHLRGRLSAATVMAAGATAPEALKEAICAIAARMAATDPKVASGVRSETSGAESVTFGAEAFAGLSKLTQPEKDALDAIYPRGIRTAEL